MRAVGRGRVVAHVRWILSAGVGAHTAFIVSVLPRVVPATHDPDPSHPLTWVLPGLVGTVVVTSGCLWARRRFPVRMRPVEELVAPEREVAPRLVQ
jgi:hypothetical protein